MIIVVKRTVELLQMGGREYCFFFLSLFVAWTVGYAVKSVMVVRMKLQLACKNYD